ncbi:MAG TPA: hypothetical protein PKU80_09210 [Candidatus Limiplasma sp.]|nr:hypothetical protein [Candidatus Limiplasma sp.]HRX07882.1 hypothetical protein [Candidatus Limiplasma sp.]
MNEYWSNEDDKKVSYGAAPPARTPRASEAARGAASEHAGGDAFTYAKNLNPRDGETAYGEPYRPKPQYGGDRSAFISEEANARRQRKNQQAQPAAPPYNGGYQIHSEEHPDGGDGHGKGGLKFLIIILILALLAAGVYVFRNDILTLIGNVFGEEVAARFKPTPEPTQTPPDVPAYVPSAPLAMKSQAVKEIDEVAGELDMNSYAVTEQNIVMSNENPDGTYDFYLFDYDTGRLLGYYDRLPSLIPCGKNIFYIGTSPYLITSRGFPLADLEALSRSAGSDVEIRPMIGGWAMVQNEDATMLNFVGENGKLISNLWYAKAFPFTAETTLAYVDTGNITDTENRYALYLLRKDGTTKRLHYVPDTDGYLESVCGMAFTPEGEMHTQDASLSLVTTTDDVTAYVNCGALSVRDPQTGLYGLFVDGVQQYPFTFDAIEPVPSDIVWQAEQTGYITRCTATGVAYPLPRSYSFILRKGDSEQVITIAASSSYPIVLD